MGHDVFISHSTKDKVFADAVCAALERDGIRCWVAPRDILPGANWAKSILKAIGEARMMVLVFSGHAQNSNHIRREVERAVHHGIPIAPIRIQDVMPKDDLEYFLSSSHWMDAITPPFERHLRQLADQVKALLKVEGKGGSTGGLANTACVEHPVYAARAGRPASGPRSGRGGRWMAGVLATLLVVSLVGLTVALALRGDLARSLSRERLPFPTSLATGPVSTPKVPVRAQPAPPDPAPAATASEDVLVVMIDKSDDMLQKAGGRTLYDLACERVLDEVEVRRWAGASIHVIPFDDGLSEGRGLFRPVEEGSPDTDMTKVREYLKRVRPSEDRGGPKYRPAVWKSVRLIVPVLRQYGPAARLSVYTAGMADMSPAGEEGRVRHALDALWGADAGGKFVIQNLTVNPRPRTPQVAIRLGQRELDPLRPQALAGRPVTMTVPVEAFISGPPADNDQEGVDATFAVQAVPLTKDAPPLTVTGQLHGRLTRRDGAAAAVLSVQPAVFRADPPACSYDLRLTFTFRVPRRDPSAAELVQSVPGGSVRLTITSRLAVRLVPQVDKIRLYPGETKDVILSLRSNSDSRGLQCQVVALVPKDLAVGLSPAAQPPGKADNATLPRELTVTLPTDGTPLDVRCRIRAAADAVPAADGGRPQADAVVLLSAQPSYEGQEVNRVAVTIVERK